MLHNGIFLGHPIVHYKDTQATIEALTGVSAGMVAYATDSNKIGFYNGASWKWSDYPPALTLGGGSDPILTLDGPNQVLTLGDVATQAELDAHEADPDAHQDLVTLGGGSDPILTLSGQQLTLGDVATQAELDAHEADPDAHIGASYYAALAGTYGSPGAANKYITDTDASQAPSAGRVVRVDAFGRVVIPDDFIGKGETATTAGLYRLLALAMGDPTYSKLLATFFHPSNVGYYLKDSNWKTWALGLAGSHATFPLSDEFLQLNYGAGTNQWSVYGSATPYSVTVADSHLTLTPKRSTDPSPSHAALGGTFTEAGNARISAKLLPCHAYFDASGSTLDYVSGIVGISADGKKAVAVFLRIPKTAVANYRPQYLEWKSYSSLAAWNPNVTTDAAWTTSWTLKKQVMLYTPTAVNLMWAWNSSLGYLYWGFSLPGSKQPYTLWDRKTVTPSSWTIQNIVIFQSYFPSSMTRNPLVIDYLRVTR